MATLVPTRAAPVPPRPAPKPGHVKVVRALYNYSAQNADELSFEEGDILYILDMTSNSNWWKARCANKQGLIPSNYVEDSMEEILNPLHDAAKRGNLTFLQECLRNKVRASITKAWFSLTQNAGKTAFRAVFSEVSVNGLDKAGCTALHWASHGGHENCLQELLKIPGIEIDVQNKLGDTPLHNAAWKGHDNIVEILLNLGARTDILNQDKKRAFDLARDPHSASLLKPKAQLRQSISHADEEYGTSEDSD